jgi:Fur family ferric uptake transcriptional regulator
MLLLLLTVFIAARA